MIKLIFSLPRSGSGLCGAILGVPKGEGGFDRSITNPKPIKYVLDRARKYDGLWTHYPHTDVMEDYLRRTRDFACYVNLRDPRDIIVSYAHAIERNPTWWMNYKHNGKRMADYPFTERIDHLIDYMHDELFRHDKWRESGICLPMYYRNNITHPIAKTRLDNKMRGIVGSYKDEMTLKQIDRATDKYRKLVELWN